MKKHYNIKVLGQVQGVWFRKNTQEKARSLGINGFVRNEKDGSVYIEAEGELTPLNSFLTWCESGPELAEVEQVTFDEGSFVGMQGFTIQH